MSKDKRAREIQNNIAAILRDDWDPLSFSGDPECPTDEYDSYVGGVYRLLASGATPLVIAEHLMKIEHDWLNNKITKEQLLPVAEKLCALDIELGTK